MKSPAKILVCCVIAAIIAGCASSVPSRFYTLSTTSGPAMMPQADYSVSVGPITIPSLVDRPQIVVRTGPNQVQVEEFERWASPLREDIGRVVVKNLIAMLGTTQINPVSPVYGCRGLVSRDDRHPAFRFSPWSRSEPGRSLDSDFGKVTTSTPWSHNAFRSHTG